MPEYLRKWNLSCKVEEQMFPVDVGDDLLLAVHSWTEFQTEPPDSFAHQTQRNSHLGDARISPVCLMEQTEM